VTIKRFTKSSIQISCDCFSVFVFDTSQLAAGLFIEKQQKIPVIISSLRDFILFRTLKVL